MKKQILFLLPCIALMACNGGSGKSGGAAQTADASNEPAKAVFTYVEPQEEIAKIIWNKLLESDEGVKQIVDEAKKWQMDASLGEYFNGASQKERYPQKTRMVFYNVIDGAEGTYDALAYFKLQCYQTNEGNWIAVIYEVTESSISDGPPRMANLSSLIYKDGDLFDYPDACLPPVQVQPLTAYKNRDYSSCAVLFDTIGFTMVSRDFWPMRYNWDGEKFVQDENSVVLASLMSQYGGFCSFSVGNELKAYGLADDCKLESGTFKQSAVSNNLDAGAIASMLENRANTVLTQNGEKMAEFETIDGKIYAINIYSPKIGFAQKIGYSHDTYGSSYVEMVTSKPLAVGFPIKNAYDKEDYAPDYTSEKKDGYYVLTRRTHRNKYEKRDIMISLYAKDENSNIERIRVFALPLQITLESEIADDNSMPDEVKSIWKKLNTEYAITDAFGEFHNCFISKNGFDAHFFDNGKFTQSEIDHPIEWELSCYMFKTKSGGYKIYTQKDVENDYWIADNEKANLRREFDEYIYENGKLTKVAVEIPQSAAADYMASAYDNTLVPPGAEVTSDAKTLTSSIPHPDYATGTSIYLTNTGFELRAASPKNEPYCTEEGDPSVECWIYNFTAHYDWDDEGAFRLKKDY